MMAGTGASTPAGEKIRVWDLPVRIVHWCFAAAIPALWWTAENGEMGWHMRIGIVLLALLVFRLLWGVVGTPTARFAHFVKGPRAVIAYLRGRSAQGIGHNPAGALSVVALLAAMIVQVALGLFAGDADDGVTGPLNPLVSYGLANTATETHETVFYLLLGLVVLHLAAVLFYRLVKRDNLIAPMITGKRAGIPGVRGIAPAPAWKAIVCALLAAGFAAWIWAGAPTGS